MRSFTLFSSLALVATASLAVVACSSADLSIGEQELTGDPSADAGAAPGSCASLGGQCVGLAPTSCPSERWASTSEGSCGDGVGVGCCLPSCPQLSPPAPSFCPDGTITPRKDASGCIRGYECEPRDGGSSDGGDAGLVTCDSLGGLCAGLSTSSCKGMGRWADMSKVTCGGAVGVGCCVTCPSLAQPPPDFCGIAGDGDPKPITSAVTTCTVGFTCSYQLDETYDGKTVAITRSGSEVVLSLSSNGSTGYSWAVETSGGLPAPQSKYIAPAPNAPVGSAGTQTFTWPQVTAVGSHTIRLVYKRSFDPVPAQTYTVTVAL